MAHGFWSLQLSPLYCLEEGSKNSKRNKYLKTIVIMANGFASQQLSLCTMLRKEVRKEVEIGILKIIVIMAQMDFGAFN